LLSQGIAITPTNSEYRLMKARIYIALNQQQRALDTLLELANTNEVEYQGLLATTAQQLKHYQHTIDAYNQLTQLQPSVGRWWLGLAVAYDSDGQFIEAAGTYRRAIALANLSESARQFSRQRLEQLGG
jgi:MSHA biogenesis protein MshN